MQRFPLVSSIVCRQPDNSGYVCAMARDFIHRFVTSVDKVSEFEKITRRITGYSQFGKYYKVGFLLLSLANTFDHLLSITFKVAYVIVELC